MSKNVPTIQTVIAMLAKMEIMVANNPSWACQQLKQIYLKGYEVNSITEVTALLPAKES